MTKSIQSKKYKNLLKLLTIVRKQSGLTQIEIAKRLNKPQSYISKYESGERRIDLIKLEEICEALNVNLLKII